MILQRASFVAALCVILSGGLETNVLGQAAQQAASATTEMINTVKQKMAAGQCTFGGQLFTTDPAVARAMAGSGFDFLWIEMQHAPYSYETVGNLIMHMKGLPAIPIIRTGEYTEAAAAHALDIGALGIIFAMTNTKAEAQQAVKVSKFPPMGIRSSGSGQFTTVWGNAARDNSNILVGVMIETPQGVKNIEQILSVPGIDLLFIGNTDLGRFSGLANTDPKYLAMVDTVVAACKKHKIPVGRMTGSADAATLNGYVKQGYQFLCGSAETGYVRNGVQSFLNMIEKPQTTK